MPKYYCDYCDIFLTHDSASVRKAHNSGWKHQLQVRNYYAELGQDKVQEVINQITTSFEGIPGFFPGLAPPIPGMPPFLPGMASPGMMPPIPGMPPISPQAGFPGIPPMMSPEALAAYNMPPGAPTYPNNPGIPGFTSPTGAGAYSATPSVPSHLVTSPPLSSQFPEQHYKRPNTELPIDDPNAKRYKLET